MVKKSPTVGMDNESDNFASETTQLPSDACWIEWNEGIIVLEVACSPTDSCHAGILRNHVRTSWKPFRIGVFHFKCSDTTQKIFGSRLFDYWIC